MTTRWPELLPSHDRFDYRPITRRPDYRWPNGARLAVYLGFNLEHFAFGDGLGACLGPASPQPDVLNHGWREYGNRVGAWRWSRGGFEVSGARRRAQNGTVAMPNQRCG